MPYYPPSDTLVASFAQKSDLTVATGTFRWYNDSGRTLTIIAVRASVGTAPTGASLVLDLNENGTTMFASGKPTITAGTNTASATPTDPALASGNYLTVDVDAIGSTVAGADLVLQVWMR